MVLSFYWSIGSVEHCVKSLQPLDIDCGRGILRNNHSGNIELRKITESFADAYLNTDSTKEKKRITKVVLEMVEQSGLRFVEPSKPRNGYRKILDEKRKRTIIMTLFGNIRKKNGSRKYARVPRLLHQPIHELWYLFPNEILCDLNNTTSLYPGNIQYQTIIESYANRFSLNQYTHQQLNDVAIEILHEIQMKGLTFINFDRTTRKRSRIDDIEEMKQFIIQSLEQIMIKLEETEQKIMRRNSEDTLNIISFDQNAHDNYYDPLLDHIHNIDVQSINFTDFSDEDSYI